ncbi:MAG: phosphate acetyltransferase [Oscillospiraceae bacterium]|nr:phosphate acetyltransferase [Oscillospiraceae bacterium]
MDFMTKIKDLARGANKTIVLAEGEEIRTVQAAAKILKEGLANLILLGNEAKIKELANGLDISKATIINPLSSDKSKEFANTLFELRKSKDMTIEQAQEAVKNVLYFGVLLVKLGYADGMVAGAVNSTGDVLRPCLQILKTAPGVSLVSSFFIMIVPNCEYGHNGMFLFSDCGLVQNPTAEEAAQIAIQSAKSFTTLTGVEAKVGMLSYSTCCSAKSELVEKMQKATLIAQKLAPEIKIDGEFQLDAAIVPAIGKAKAPNCEIAGQANVLIFPDLNSGNIGYKLVERLAKAEAYGPITQGIAKPVNDLSRGCSAEDIVGVTALTAVQAMGM